MSCTAFSALPTASRFSLSSPASSAVKAVKDEPKTFSSSIARKCPTCVTGNTGSFRTASSTDFLITSRRRPSLSIERDDGSDAQPYPNAVGAVSNKPVISGWLMYFLRTAKVQPKSAANSAGDLTAKAVRSKNPSTVGEKVVPRAGLEPACAYARRILSPLRLPFRHLGVAAIRVFAFQAARYRKARDSSP